MPWRGPPPEVARRVREALGDQVWTDLEARWKKVLSVDPTARLTQWYRSPEEVRAEYLTNPRAAWLTQHGLGLAVDVTPTQAKREAFVRAARAQGFSVQTYPSSRHVHVAALSPARWKASPLLPLLRELLGQRPTR